MILYVIQNLKVAVHASLLHMIDDNGGSTQYDTYNTRALGEATTIVLLIIVAVAATGAISFAVQGFSDSLEPESGGQIYVDQEGETLTFTVSELDSDVGYLEFRGDFDATAADFSVNGTSGASSDVAQNVGPGGSNVRVAADLGDIAAGDIVVVENVNEGDRITVVTLDGDGNENTIRVYEAGPTGTA